MTEPFRTIADCPAMPELQPGVTCIAGVAGSGKSTLARTLTGSDPDAQVLDLFAAGIPDGLLLSLTVSPPVTMLLEDLPQGGSWQTDLVTLTQTAFDMGHRIVITGNFTDVVGRATGSPVYDHLAILLSMYDHTDLLVLHHPRPSDSSLGRSIKQTHPLGFTHVSARQMPHVHPPVLGLR